jgi:hypothetical protein
LGQRSAKYRRFAEECLLIAAGAEEEPTRAIFRLMAQVWFRLAQENEGTENVVKSEMD